MPDDPVRRDSTDTRKIGVLLADDNVIVREGVRALLARQPDIEVLGVASDYDELLAAADALGPQVIITDIRMPPNFQREGIDAAREVRQRHPGTGVVVLSQYDEPEYAISLLAEGAAGYAYLLKDRIAEGDQLGRAIREVATGGSMLDPAIVQTLMRPVTTEGDLSVPEERLLHMVAEGKPVKAIAVVQKSTAEAVSADIESLFLKLAKQASSGTVTALRRLRMLHQAIVQREELGESLSRLLPGGVADMLRDHGRRGGETERLTVTVLMSDIRGYCTIAEHTDPSELAAQLNGHRAEMNRAVLGAGGTVMQFVGDAVFAVFGAPLLQLDHADRALRAAAEMHAAQAALNAEWQTQALPAFGLGIGLTTGEVAAALLGSDERLEYTLVGDVVNLAQRLQQWAAAGETVLSAATRTALRSRPEVEDLGEQTVKGRDTPVRAYRIRSASTAAAGTGGS
jgi:adenylate cyclase